VSSRTLIVNLGAQPMRVEVYAPRTGLTAIFTSDTLVDEFTLAPYSDLAVHLRAGQYVKALPQ
jgi:hypothetical protein